MRFRELRPQLAAFASACEGKLRKNNYKGGWDDCTRTWLLAQLSDAVAELRVAADDSEVLDECCDIANFAMMIFINTSESEKE